MNTMFKRVFVTVTMSLLFSFLLLSFILGDISWLWAAGECVEVAPVSGYATLECTDPMGVRLVFSIVTGVITAILSGLSKSGR